MSKLLCSVLKISGGEKCPNAHPPGCAPAWKAVSVEPSPTCYPQNLLLVSFVTHAYGNIAHGPLVFVVNRYCC